MNVLLNRVTLLIQSKGKAFCQESFRNVIWFPSNFIKFETKYWLCVRVEVKWKKSFCGQLLRTLCGTTACTHSQRYCLFQTKNCCNHSFQQAYCHCRKGRGLQQVSHPSDQPLGETLPCYVIWPHQASGGTDQGIGRLGWGFCVYIASDPRETEVVSK